MHARAVRIKDTCNLDLRPVLTEIVEEQGFGTPLAFVIAGARPDRIYVAPVIFRLRVNGGVAVDLACRGLEYATLQALREAKHVDRTVHAGLGRLDRIVLVVDGRSRARQIIDLVYFNVEWKRHIVPDQLKARVSKQVLDVPLCPGKKVVDADDVMPVINQPVAQVRAKKARTSSYENGKRV